MPSPSGPKYAHIPVITLDPSGADHQGEAARLRAAGEATGGLVRVGLPGGLVVWAVTTHELVEQVVRSPDMSKNYKTWTAYKTGELTPDNPIIGMIAVDNLVTADGEDHRRLRRPITTTFTGRRVEALLPSVTATVGALLDELPGHARPDGVVDLRAHYCAPLPLRVICELLGVPEAEWPRLRHLVDSIFRTDTTPEQVAAVMADIPRFLGELIAVRAADPGADLTSALIAARAEGTTTMSDRELADTLWVLLTAGHETTIGLIGNTIRALLGHPSQLALALAEDRFADAVTETLRWDSSIGNFLARYPVRDVEIAGVTIPAGDAIMAPYTAVGRDPHHHGATADVFDLTRDQRPHLAFGAGRHICPGSHLAQQQATLAVKSLFTRYPDMVAAFGEDDPRPVPSLFTNALAEIPVRLAGRD
ncbi:Cytochrome P450 107B1 [Actinomadura rubteroloni]|uniref:Cytochrome P450 107B1 n=1 Tax=Actinomadura rubteroloni TaxID=1926885 RepID=A0A2P4UKN4_9ACTN|nr:Cytochrome P450 107B1 [Actinomadura rubteroloni]